MWLNIGWSDDTLIHLKMERWVATVIFWPYYIFFRYWKHHRYAQRICNLESFQRRPIPVIPNLQTLSPSWPRPDNESGCSNMDIHPVDGVPCNTYFLRPTEHQLGILQVGSFVFSFSMGITLFTRKCPLKILRPSLSYWSHISDTLLGNSIIGIQLFQFGLKTQTLPKFKNTSATVGFTPIIWGNDCATSWIKIYMISSVGI